MKKSFLFFVVLFSLSWTVSDAQNPIAVQNNSTPTFYISLTTAIENAIDGDTIYIPGGGYDAITISKRLHLVGVGHNPDSTSTTSRTLIAGITIETGADNGSITGIFTAKFYGSPSIIFNSTVNGYTIKRCALSSGVGTNGSVYVQNIYIIENIIGAYYNAFSCLVSIDCYSPGQSIINNFILGSTFVNNSIIKNNIFLSTSDGSGYCQHPLPSNACVVENNIFAVRGGSTNCVYRNNINGAANGADANGNIGDGNFTNDQLLSDVFVNYDPATMATFTDNGVYMADFHLPSGSPYNNAGRDGTDIGIYGGISPWKEGSAPFNPHIQSVIVNHSTNTSGNLDVNIKVAAQNR